MTRVETERLTLRPPEAGDLGDYLALLMRPEVGEWLRPAPLEPFDEDEVRRVLEGDVDHWAEHGFGPWAVLARAGGGFRGRVGLRRTSIEGRRAIELAWTIDPDSRGEGLAPEAAGAAVELARELGVERLVAMTLPRNLASRRVAEKLGMTPAGAIVHAGLPHVLYRLALA